VIDGKQKIGVILQIPFLIEPRALEANKKMVRKNVVIL
jgi:hypothetical protein